MTKKLLFTFLTSTLISQFAVGQITKEETNIDYHRSSLHTILLESEEFPNKATVLEAYYNAEFPDKYNNHDIGEKSFNPELYKLSEQEKIDGGTTRTGAGKALSSFASGMTAGIIDSVAADYPLIIDKYFKQNKIGNQIVAKWFNRQEDGSFNTELIKERGQYDASALKIAEAKSSTLGQNILTDAGEELIDKTFVTVSRLNYVSNEPVAMVIYLVALEASKELPMGQGLAQKVAEKIYNKTKEGYSVWTTTYLYKLHWNDSINTAFYKDLYIMEGVLDEDKKVAFDNSDLFEMEFIGSEKSSSLVTFSLKSSRTEEQIVELATVRNVDAVFSKLQKNYDVFKPKTPLLSGNPITAKIGMKEGLEGGEKFEVLQQSFDEVTGKTTYNRVGTIKVDKKSVWDNRFGPNEEDPDSSKKSDKDMALDRTTFEGGKNYGAGMLIRQIK